MLIQSVNYCLNAFKQQENTHISEQLEHFKCDNLNNAGVSKNAAPVNIQLNRSLSARLYNDCRPNCLETSTLQKGAVLLFNGRELIEEGVGFGVPVVKYEDKTFFSHKAQVSVENGSDGAVSVTKVFTLDTVSVKRFGKASYINDGFYTLSRETFELLYLKHTNFNAFFNKLMEIRELAQIKTEFLQVKPRGTVSVNYQFKPGSIEIKADFTKIALEKCKELLLLNEQGSVTFQKYTDTNGIVLVGNKIGAWTLVTANEACLQSLKGLISFTVKNLGGARLYRGWEQTRNRFSWAGLSYSMLPNRGFFEYRIALN